VIHRENNKSKFQIKKLSFFFDRVSTIESFAIHFLVLIFIPISLNGCGTEVGNGHSGPGEDPKASSAEGSSETGTEADGASKANNEMEPAQDATIDQASVPAMGFEYGLLFVECASPFGDDVASPVELRFGPTGPTIKAVADTSVLNAEWEVKVDDVFRVFATNQSASDYKVTLLDSNRQSVTSSYTCGEVTETTGVSLPNREGLFDKRSVILTNSGKETKLDWYLNQIAASPVKFELIKITILQPGSQSEVSFDKPEN